MKRHSYRLCANAALLVGLSLLASSPINQLHSVPASQFSEWSTPVSLGQDVNSAFENALPEIADSIAGPRPHREWHAGRPNQVLEWNQIFIDTLIATNTANSSSQRLGAIVHTAIFDAYNGIERRYTPIFVHNSAPHGASRRAAVIAAAYTALVGLFPSQTAGPGCQLCGFASGAQRRWRRMAANLASAASPGEPR